MSNAEFIKRATAAVVDYFNRHVDVTDNFELIAEDTFVVWSCKTLQNHKALISTTVPRWDVLRDHLQRRQGRNVP